MTRSPIPGFIVLGIIVLIIIGAIAGAIPHAQQNDQGWTKDDIHAFIVKCEDYGLVGVPTYCKCVGQAVAANVEKATIDLQFSHNPPTAVINHNELTQGEGCTY